MIRALTILLFLPYLSVAQPNCNIYKISGNDSCYQACLVATSGAGAQGSRFSQMRFDQAIALCPTLDYAYMEKAVPYLKRGDFVTWIQLIDKAVVLNPKEHLGYRGWCKYQFLKDYQGAIRDLELLDSLKPANPGYCITGDYHLAIAKALCYKALGAKEKAIVIIERQLLQKDYTPLFFDYLHLGVLKMETGNPEKALACFNQAISSNDYYAETYYYRALVYKKLGQMDNFRQDMEKARAYYLAGKKMFDPYYTPADKIFLSDIERSLSE